MTTLPLPDVYRIRVILDFFFFFVQYIICIYVVYLQSLVYTMIKRGKHLLRNSV